MILGLMGFAGVGKDEAAAVLAEDGWLRIGFADALRELALAADPVVVPQAEGVVEMDLRLSDVVAIGGWDEAKRSEPEVRRLLQALGVGVREVVDPDAWVRALERAYAPYCPVNLVVPDVRFPNEIEWVRSYDDGYIIRVDRPGVGPVNAHVSEHAWVGVEPDQVVVNDGTLDTLAVRIRNAAVVCARRAMGVR